jgi:hypothetical protein
MGYNGSTIHTPKPKDPRRACAKDLMFMVAAFATVLAAVITWLT